MFKSSCLIAIAAMFLAACDSDQSPKTVLNNEPKKPVLTGPFRFHKLVEVAPGQDYDILSWGRAGGDKGSFLILHSDSASKEYTTTTGDLEGQIVNVYNSDMDTDGNPELLIQSLEKDSIPQSHVYAFEFNDSQARKLDFPKLSSDQKKGYRGSDHFYMKEGNLIREYPIYDKNDSTAKPTGQKRVLEYSMRGNDLRAKDLSKDTLKNLSAPVAVTEPKKQETTEKKTETKKKSSSTSSSSKKKKKSSSSSSSKKKKRHRR